MGAGIVLTDGSNLQVALPFHRSSALELFRTALAIVKLAMRSDRNGASKLYTLLGDRYYLGRRTRYLNLGYWERAEDYDDACDALAEQLGFAVGLGPGDRLLDVGFGFGDQDDYWLRRFSPAVITGINITPLHVQTASLRFPDQRIQFRLGSATDMDLPDASYDRVTALECAFHFDTRAAFFREAFRVLKPGGRLGLADILPRPGTHSGVNRYLFRLTRSFWQIPDANWMEQPEYEAALWQSGFVDLSVRSIREQVYTPFWRYTTALVHSPTAGRICNPVARQVVRLWPPILDRLEYLIVSARKPG